MIFPLYFYIRLRQSVPKTFIHYFKFVIDFVLRINFLYAPPNMVILSLTGINDGKYYFCSIKNVCAYIRLVIRLEYYT